MGKRRAWKPTEAQRKVLRNLWRDLEPDQHLPHGGLRGKLAFRVRGGFRRTMTALLNRNLTERDEDSVSHLTVFGRALCNELFGG